MAVNMSYCRYQNTLTALGELHELESYDLGEISELSDDELWALKRLVAKCETIAENFKYCFEPEPDASLNEALENFESQLEDFQNEEE